LDKSFMKKFLVFILIFSVACATKARFYPNAKYKQVGEAQANADLAQCENESEQYLADSKGKQVAKGAGSGAALGAVFGLIGGGVRGAARGAVGGAAVGATAGAISPDKLKQRYVVKCLGDKGYEVLGYD
jgi:outer membrane lipoprotein SlyB